MQFPSQRLVLLEAGCGVGNCIFPLLEDELNIFVYACDFSPRAVEFVQVKLPLVAETEPLPLTQRCRVRRGTLCAARSNAVPSSVT